MNKTITRIIALVAVLAVIILLAFPDLVSFGKDSNPKKEEEKQAAPNQGVVIDAQVVNYKTFNNDITLAGSLLANESVELASEISGKIDAIYFKEGQYVKKGQLLLTTNVDDVKANLQRLRYTAKLNKETEERQKQLLESEAISKEEYDIAFTNYKTIQAEIAEVEAQIEKSRLSAPFSGYIGLRYVSEGSYITPSTQIASLYSVDPIKIEFSVPSRFSTLVNEGNNISFVSEAENINREAKIYAIEPQIDPVTRTLKVRAQCDNPNNTLIPGQFVRVKLSLESEDNAILVPTTAIMPKSNGHMVFIINNGEAMAQDVELGIRTATEVEIVKGVSQGDTVAIAGVPQLKNKAAVNIKTLKEK
jgi:membrane fusion protein (multidrug efflux system)